MQRLLALDGIRGVAALSVLFSHAAYLGKLPIFGFGHLAVDLFFVLSGYVLGAAYEGALRRDLTWLDYARLRIIRLFPMILAGVAVSVLAVSGGDFDFPAPIVALALAQALCIPVLFQDAFLFPLNPVQWSLACELVANGVHAAITKHLSNFRLAVVIAVAAGCLAAIAPQVDSLSLGWGTDNVHVGLARVAFSFFVGIALNRSRLADKMPRVPTLTLMAAVAIVLGLPAAFGRLQGVVELVVILLVFPSVILFGVRAKLSPASSSLSRVLGGASYPLYLLHYPVFILIAAALPAGDVLIRAGYVGVAIVGLVASCWAIDNWIDRPVRKWLLAVTSRQSRTPRPAV